MRRRLMRGRKSRGRRTVERLTCICAFCDDDSKDRSRSHGVAAIATADIAGLELVMGLSHVTVEVHAPCAAA